MDVHRWLCNYFLILLIPSPLLLPPQNHLHTNVSLHHPSLLSYAHVTNVEVFQNVLPITPTLLSIPLPLPLPLPHTLTSALSTMFSRWVHSLLKVCILSYNSFISCWTSLRSWRPSLAVPKSWASLSSRSESWNGHTDHWCQLPILTITCHLHAKGITVHIHNVQNVKEAQFCIFQMSQPQILHLQKPDSGPFFAIFALSKYSSQERRGYIFDLRELFLRNFREGQSTKIAQTIMWHHMVE